MMSNLIQRTLSGAVYVAVVVAAILTNPCIFGVLFVVVSTLAVREMHVLQGDATHVRVYGMLLNILLFVSIWLWLFMPSFFPLIGSTPALVSTTLYALVLVCALLTEMRYVGQTQPMRHWGDLLVGQVMVALPFGLMLVVLSCSKWLLLALFVLLWTNDTGAYCAGSLTAQRKGGNHKMSPHISPKKSWEGLIGGALLTIAVAYLLSAFGWFDAIGSSDILHYMLVGGFALLAVIAGTLGDLMESLFKRSIGVKDSGKFLPGHGGVLDRFDSLLLATPILCIYVLLICR